ncbi:proteinaceous RNase P 1, chloroplastic/mitochondrial isoform X3 [Citrus clementina]|uniref:proteinaceous RNase P 1, chloroplastic/mitochondrial isoform X3 n=1 Tax=Citrus clementina TaxID=85681 RepID=UPI000CED47F9|nr:proteinaceous RNase P 1, chloroplastic/mitochondrial isoform X3 [Citrus x clementina]
MASSLTVNTLQQQNQLFSLTLCKSSPPTLTVFNFQFLSRFLSSSPPKRTPLLVFKAHVRNTQAKLSTTETEHETSTVTLRTRKGTASGASSLGTRDKRVDSAGEEKDGKRLTKDNNSRKNFAFLKSREMSSGNSSLRSKDKKIGIKSSKTVNREVDNQKMEQRTNDSGQYKVRGITDEKGSKKSKKDRSEQFQLRVELDMCSKRGDVMGAIRLYDKAQREGIKLGQYHYNVLLYLCSSAAVGVVKPAKSGSGMRTLDTFEVSTMNSTELGDSRDMDNNGQLDYGSSPMIDKLESNSSYRFDDLDSTFNEKENLGQFSNGHMKLNSQLLDGRSNLERGPDDQSRKKDWSIDNQDADEIRLSEDAKKYAFQRGFEIYEKMCLDEVPMNEASLTAVGRMAMSMSDGDMAFDMVKRMKSLGINPRLRSYGPALSVFCNNGDVDKACSVEEHMLEHGVYPEEPELEALLRVSVEAGKGDRVYYLLHKLRTSVRKVSPSTADVIAKWFNSKEAARLGKKKWNESLIRDKMENKGGGWHGLGWLGKGKWIVSHTTVGGDALCKCCGEKLAIIDLDPIETEKFAESVASIAIKRERNSSFQKFQKWLDYYGPFEAVVDAANVGLYSQRNFKPARVNAVVNGIRQKFPSKKWPLIVLHNRRITGHKMDQPVNRALIEKWKNADALYATPTGSNDDWYWLYAAIKFKCLLVTNDEMRDHTFQLLGNDFFPRWKERHQVRFSFSDAGPEFYMPPPCSVVIQESEKGNWHIPIASKQDYDDEERRWLCVTRANSHMNRQNSYSSPKAS